MLVIVPMKKAKTVPRPQHTHGAIRVLVNASLSSKLTVIVVVWGESFFEEAVYVIEWFIQEDVGHC